MKVLVVGSAGQVGRELVASGSSFPELEVVGLDRRQLDITNGDAIAVAFAEHAPEVVINAAAYTAVDAAETDRASATAVNADAPRLLASAAAERAIPLFHISTDYVFPGTLDPPHGYRVDDEVGPTGVYGATKLEGEIHVRQLLRHHLILRVSWVFGRYGKNFVKTMVRLARERAELRVVADQHGRPTSARSITAALLRATDEYRSRGRLDWGTYHFAGDPPTTWHRFAEAIVEVARTRTDLAVHAVTPIATADYPTAARRPWNSILECPLDQSWMPRTLPSWRDALPEVVDAALVEV